MTTASLLDAELLEHIERDVWASDRAFFEHHCARRYRLRPAFAVEIEQFARLGEIERDLPEGLCWWVVIHHVAPGARIRFPLAAAHDMPTEVPEAHARGVWRDACPPAARAVVREVKRRSAARGAA